MDTLPIKKIRIIRFILLYMLTFESYNRGMICW